MASTLTKAQADRSTDPRREGRCRWRLSRDKVRRAGFLVVRLRCADHRRSKAGIFSRNTVSSNAAAGNASVANGLALNPAEIACPRVCNSSCANGRPLIKAGANMSLALKPSANAATAPVAIGPN